MGDYVRVDERRVSRCACVWVSVSVSVSVSLSVSISVCVYVSVKRCVTGGGWLVMSYLMSVIL